MSKNLLILVLTLVLTGCVTTHEFNKGDCAVVDEAAINDGRHSDGTPVLVTEVREKDKEYDAFIRWRGTVKGGIPVIMDAGFSAKMKKFDNDFMKAECPDEYKCITECGEGAEVCAQVCRP